MADEPAQLAFTETGPLSDAGSSIMSPPMMWQTSSVEPTKESSTASSRGGSRLQRQTSAPVDSTMLRVSTMGCLDEVPDPAEGSHVDRFTTRRRSSIMGIEMMATAQRRISQSTLLSSDLGGSRRLSRSQIRRSSVMGCESLAQFQKQFSGVSMGVLEEGSRSDSSDDSDGGAEMKKQEPIQSIPSRRLSAVQSRSFTRNSTLQNSVEATRLREELQKPNRRSQKSVTLSIESDFCGADASSSSGSRATSRRQTIADGRRPSISGSAGSRRQTLAEIPPARFRSRSTLNFMAAISNDVLHEVEVLKKCEADFVDVLIEYTEVQFFKENTEVVKAGEKPNGIYIVAHGTIQALVNDQVVATFKEGQMFCLEAALEVKAVATIRTETFADCRVIPQKGLSHALKSFPASKTRMTEIAKKYISELVPHVDLFEITRVQSEGFRRPSLHAGHRRRSSLSCGMPVLNPTATGPLTRQTLGESAFQKTLTAATGESHKQNDAVHPPSSIDTTPQQSPPRRERSNSVIGFEISAADAHRDHSKAASDSRRVSLMESAPSMLPGVSTGLADPVTDSHNADRRMSHRRQSVMGCESLGMLGAKMDFGLMALPELSEANDNGSDSEDSGLLSDPLCSDSENEREAEEAEKEEQASQDSDLLSNPLCSDSENELDGQESEKEEQEELPAVGEEPTTEDEAVAQELPLDREPKPTGEHKPTGDQKPMDDEDLSKVAMLSAFEAPSLPAVSLGTSAGAKEGGLLETELQREPLVPPQDHLASIRVASELQTASLALPAQDGQHCCAEHSPPTEDPQAESQDYLQHGTADPAMTANTVAEPSDSEGSGSEDFQLHPDHFLAQTGLSVTDQSQSLKSLNPYGSSATFTTQTSDSRWPRPRPGQKLQPLWNKLHVMRAVRWRACRPHRKLRATAKITSTGLTTPGHWRQYTSVEPAPSQILSSLSQSGSRPVTASSLWSRPTTASHPKCSSHKPKHELDMPWWERSDGPLATPRDSATHRESALEFPSPLRSLMRPPSVPRLDRQGELVELPAATVLPPLNLDDLLRCSLKSGQTPSIGKLGDGETHGSSSKSRSSRGGMSPRIEGRFTIGNIGAAVGRVSVQRRTRQYA